MSIQIGTASLNTQNVTNRERIILRSDVQSNLINIASALPDTYIVIDNFSLGKSNNTFQIFENERTRLLELQRSNTTIFPNLTLQNGLDVSGLTRCRSNIICNSNVSSKSLTTENAWIQSKEPLNSNTPVLKVSRVNNTDALNVLANGNINIPNGSVGIGTTIWNSNTYLLHVDNSAYISQTMYASNLLTWSINNPEYRNGIDFTSNKMIIKGTTEVIGSFDVTGRIILSCNIDVQSLNVRDTAVVPILMIDNSNTSVLPTLSLVYSGDIDNGNTSNIIDIQIRPEDSNIYAFVMDHHGKIGLGTDSPGAIIDIFGTANHIADNLVRYRNESDSCGSFVIGSNATVGIGTDFAKNKLYVRHCDEPKFIVGVDEVTGSPLYGSNEDYNALIAINNEEIYNTFNRSLVQGLSNDIEVMRISNKGHLLIGGIASCNVGVKDQYAIDVNVDKIARLPRVELHSIFGEPRSNVIAGNQVRLHNLNTLSTCNAILSNAQVQNGIFHYIFASNYEIMGMKCFEDEPGLFSVMVSNFHFEGTAILFASNFMSDMQTDPVAEGKLKIVCEDPPGNSISRGISVVGNKDTSIRVQSYSFNPLFELTNTNYNAALGMEVGGALFLRHGTNDVKMRLGADNTVDILNNIKINQRGLGINQTSTIDNPLQVRGRSFFTNLNNQPVLYVNGGATGEASTRLVGICTNTPTASLDVQGNMFVKDDSVFNNSLVITKSVGIGTTSYTLQDVLYVEGRTQNCLSLNNKGSANTLIVTTSTSNAVIDNQGRVGLNTMSPRFLLDIHGNVNFDGRLFNNGVEYKGSQWNTTTNNDVYFIGNVGVGTYIPTYGIHLLDRSCYIGSNLVVNCNVNVNGTVFSQGSFVTTSDKTVKIDLTPIKEPLERVEKINGYTYLRVDTGKRETGLVAQEVLDILPEVVNASSDSPLLSIAYGNMAGLFVEAIKELHTKVQRLEKEVAELKRQ
jgi:hypothetical protein